MVVAEYLPNVRCQWCNNTWFLRFAKLTASVAVSLATFVQTCHNFISIPKELIICLIGYPYKAATHIYKL